jgi:hypothetical protein
MAQLSSPPQVLCRPAIESDRADVLEFCRNIWDGEDYVPYVWDEWFRDPTGLLAVAEYDGHAIGCSKITQISTGQWWLEGFRVDPKYQGLRIPGDPTGRTRRQLYTCDRYRKGGRFCSRE